MATVFEQSSAPRNDSFSWYAIHIRYRFEKKAVQQLQEKSIETFLPLRTEIHPWSDRHKEIRVPLFPGYAFVHIDQSQPIRFRVTRHSRGRQLREFSGTSPRCPEEPDRALAVAIGTESPVLPAPISKRWPAGAHSRWMFARPRGNPRPK